MNPKVRKIVWPAPAAAGALLALAAGLGFLLRDRRTIKTVTAADEEVAANALFEDRFRGPGYFHASSPDGWLDNTEAHEQLIAVARTRGLDERGIREMQRLIERMTEPHPYRSVGGGRVKAIRLNLALDGK